MSPCSSSSTQLVLPPAVRQDENQYRTKVFLTNITSPGHFYLRTEAANQAFLQLSQQLRRHFETIQQQALQEDLIPDNLICALELSPGNWNRCRVLKSHVDFIEVKLIDAGAVVTVSKNQLYQLDQPWKDSPPLAFRCALWGLRPTGDAVKWPLRCTEVVKDIVDTAIALFFQSYHVAEDATHYVRLYYEVSKYLNSILIPLIGKFFIK